MNKRSLYLNDKWDITLETYGMQIKGAVPKLALIDMAAPKDIMNNEIK